METRDKNLSRSFRIDREKLDPEKRTIELAFSSEEPVERWGENEVLSHEKGDYDFSRLNNDHPLLLGHNESNPLSQIGVVESARVDVDKVGRAVVRFSKSELGQQIWQDVVDGIRKLVSVGYDRTAIVNSEKAKNGMITTRYRWQPSHIAIVPVPADTTVGVGRDREVDSPQKPKSEQRDQNFMPEETKIDEVAVRSDERAKTQTSTLTSERARTKEIAALADSYCEKHGEKNNGELKTALRKMANEAMEKGEAVQDFKVRCMDAIMQASPAKTISIRDCTDDPAAYSLLRGIQSAVKRKSEGKEAVPDGREGEVHQEFLRQARNSEGGLGYEPAGFQVPHDISLRCRGKGLARDMQAAVFPSGGAFVPNILTVPVIEILRNMSVLDKAGKRTMAGLTGNIIIPRQEAAATAYAVSEIGALTASQQVLGQIALAPKRVGAQQAYSKQFVMQSTPDAEQFMRDDLFKVISLKWDYLGLNGTGAVSEPLGLMNTPGIASIIFGATPTYIKLIAMETAIRAANVLDDLTYVSTPATRGSLKGVAEALTGATTVGGMQNAIWKGGWEDGEVNGYPALASNQIPNNQVILGAWTHLIHAIWGGLDVVVDQLTKAGNAEIVLTINTWGDFALRHPQAFCLSADAGNQ